MSFGDDHENETWSERNSGKPYPEGWVWECLSLRYQQVKLFRTEVFSEWVNKATGAL